MDNTFGNLVVSIGKCWYLLYIGYMGWDWLARHVQVSLALIYITGYGNVMCVYAVLYLLNKYAR
jgi:hypothetical protein